MQISNLEHLQVADLEELKGSNTILGGNSWLRGQRLGYPGLIYPHFRPNPSYNFDIDRKSITISNQDIDLTQKADSVVLNLGYGGGVTSTATNNATILATNS